MGIENFDNLPTTTHADDDLFVVQKNNPPVGSKEKSLLPAVAAALLAKNDLAVTTAWTDNADGTGDVELTFTLGGSALTEPLSGFFYVSEVATGLSASSLDTGASAGKGVIAPILSAATSHYHFITNATGELDLTLTSNADSYWIVFQQNDGTLLISDELAITGP